MTGFIEKRRQQFATESHSFFWKEYLHARIIKRQQQLPGGDSIEQRRSLGASDVAEDSYCLLSLNYTAGEPVAALRDELAQVVLSYEQYRHSLAAYEEIPDITVLRLEEASDFGRYMQLLGLAYLLHRRDLIPRIAALADSAYEGRDTLNEDLLGYALEGRYDVDEWFHEYWRPLIEAMYLESAEESAAKLNAYCLGWYKAMHEAPWHDGHLRIDGDNGDYFGYWAFEAGAVAMLCDLNDTEIDHMVYPKDLVAWSRANRHLANAPVGTASDAHARLRIEADQSCPQSGWWMTPARAGSRRYFNIGEVMPDFGASSDYGQTIWQWDTDQSSPRL